MKKTSFLISLGVSALILFGWYWSSGLQFRSFVLAKLAKVILPEIRPENTTKALHISRQALNLMSFFQPGAVNSRLIDLGDGLSVYVFLSMNTTGPNDPTDPLVPVLMWFHGGGFVEGSAIADQKNSQQIANMTGFIVVSVEYRLAPEHVFPAAVEDGMRALAWLLENIRFYGGDRDKVIIGGESAGGNLAAATIIGLIMDGGRNFRGHVLGYLAVYPCLDHGSYTESHYKYRHTSGFLPLIQMQWYYALYLGEGQSLKAQDIRACPARAPNDILRKFPPTFMILAEQDVLYDEGINFIRKLKINKVTSDYATYKGTIHGFFGRPSFGAAGRDSLMRACGELKRMLPSNKMLTQTHIGRHAVNEINMKPIRDSL